VCSILAICVLLMLLNWNRYIYFLYHYVMLCLIIDSRDQDVLSFSIFYLAFSAETS